VASFRKFKPVLANCFDVRAVTDIFADSGRPSVPETLCLQGFYALAVGWARAVASIEIKGSRQIVGKTKDYPGSTMFPLISARSPSRPNRIEQTFRFGNLDPKNRVVTMEKSIL
jgi:hypothetical protein